MKTNRSVPTPPRSVLSLLAIVLLTAPLAAQPPAVEIPPDSDPEPTAADTPAEPLAPSSEDPLAPRSEAPQAAVPDDSLPADVLAAAERFRNGGQAPIIQRSTTRQYPFGESQPTLRCTPDRVCDIELQAGEVIYDVAIGDQTHWISQPLTSGSAEKPIPHVAIKPLEHDLATNLVIGTSKRTYHIGLISPAVADLNAGTVHYERHLSFYYPAEIVSSWNRAEDLRRAELERRANQPPEEDKNKTEPGLPLAASLAELNFDYRLKASKKSIPWQPIAVYDDSERTYIQLPRKASATTQPAIVLEEHGQSVVPNYHYDPDRRQLVVHTLFRRATLFEGVGRKRLEVSIFASPR